MPVRAMNRVSVLGAGSERMRKCPGTAPPGPSARREGQTTSEGMKVVKLLDQASEDGPRGSLREQVSEHHDAGEVFDGDNATVDESRE